MEVTIDEYRLSSALLWLSENGSVPPFIYGCRKRRASENLSQLVHGTGAVSKAVKKKKKKIAPVPDGMSPLTPVKDEAVLIASSISSSLETSLGNSTNCTDSFGPKQLRTYKRKTPVTKSGSTLKTPEDLKSTPDDCILPDALPKMEKRSHSGMDSSNNNEIKADNQLPKQAVKIKFVFKGRGEEIISRVPTQMNISNWDAKIKAGQLLESNHHQQPPSMVPNTNSGLSTGKEAAALARQRRILICRQKKYKCQLPPKFS